MKLGQQACYGFAMVLFLAIPTRITAQNQSYYIRNDAIAHEKGKTTDPAKETSTSMTDHNPIAKIQGEGLKRADGANPIEIVQDSMHGKAMQKNQYWVQPMMISPNPVIDVAHITFPNHGMAMEARMDCIDLNGQLVLQKNIFISTPLVSEAFIFNDLEKGMYLIRIQVGKDCFVQKMIKQ